MLLDVTQEERMRSVLSGAALAVLIISQSQAAAPSANPNAATNPAVKTTETNNTGAPAAGAHAPDARGVGC